MLDFCAEHNVTPDIQVISIQQIILSMVAAGYGVAVLPRQLLGTPPPGCRIKRLRLPAPGYRLRMVWLRGSPSTALHRFLEMLSSAAALAEVSGADRKDKPGSDRHKSSTGDARLLRPRSSNLTGHSTVYAGRGDDNDEVKMHG